MPGSLSELGLFQGDLAQQIPATGVVRYELNVELFTDHARKQRFVWLPPASSATWRPEAVGATDLEFPIGTLMVKTFAMPGDLREVDGPAQLLETRILRHEPDGWVGYPYVWKPEQDDARLDLLGRYLQVTWRDEEGESRTSEYVVPHANQCKACHKAEGGRMAPIGPRLRNLNREVTTDRGIRNQIDHWMELGLLAAGTPRSEHLPRLARWDDPSSGTLAERARAWLDVNCAHCHNPEGPASNTGLHLHVEATDPYAYGVWRTAVAPGKGSGGLVYDIVPGRPDESILMHRIESTEAGVAMPELGRRLVDREGSRLIREWIASMASGQE